MFNKILELLREKGSLSISEIAFALQSDVSAVRPMLDLLERKGKIKKRKDLPCSINFCTGCRCRKACGSIDTETYYQL